MAENRRFGREPVQVLEFDQDFCNLTYGVAPCTAALQEGQTQCFNTRSTCQSPANYDKGVKVLRFIDKRSPGPTDSYYIPSLTGVKVTPAKLNPGGANSNASALGQRASISATFQDHPHNDKMVDPYRILRNYTPIDRGTFWTKWRARNPYYMQRPIRLRTGYLVNGTIVDEISRDFVVTGFEGPDSSGRVTMKGKDVLTLAEDEKAQAPVASGGKLSTAITETDTQAQLSPSGVGESEYPANGYIRIGKEVVSFTRSGDTLTIQRGQYGTENKEHKENNTAQLCLQYTSEKPQDILYDLLRNYAGIPADYLDTSQWNAEALDFLPRLYSSIITEPQGVAKLISEMCQQMYFTIWWDERLGKVVLKSVRLAQEEEVTELDDNRHLIADSISWKDLADELITQVWVYYGQLNPTEKIDQGSNYATIAITADPSAEGPNRHNLRRVKTIFSRWIDATNASAAEDLGRRLLSRYGNAPRQITFKVDAKDGHLWLGDYIRLTNRLRVSRFGLPSPVNLQIFEAEESSLGSEFQFTAQEFIPALIGGDDDAGGGGDPGGGGEDPKIRIIPLTSDLLNVNLRTLHDALFGAPTGNEKITFIVREGVVIGSSSTSTRANLPYGQFLQEGDPSAIYNAGQSLVSLMAVGTVPILQRRSIGAYRRITAGQAYPGLGPADYEVREYPVSTAIDTGAWPEGVELALIVEAGGKVLGAGGNGSAHITTALVVSSSTPVDTQRKGLPGGDGGDGILVRHQIRIINGGILAGGGGGGAVAGRVSGNSINRDIEVICGGGGAGRDISDVSKNKYGNGSYYYKYVRSASQPGIGSDVSGGGFGELDTSRNGYTFIKRAGAGGNLGLGGGVAVSINSFAGNLTYGYGGLPGKAISQGANLIEWINKGDVRGEESN